MVPGAALNEKLAAILSVSRRLNSERDLLSLLDLIAHEAMALLDCDRASIFLLDRARNELWSKVALGSGEILRFDARLGVVGTAALTGRTVNVTDAYHDSRFYSAIDQRTGYRTTTLLAMPMRNQGGEIIGAFEVLNKNKGVFTPQDEEVLEALGAHTAVAVETAQLVGELKRSHTELEQQNAHLRREVERQHSTQSIIGTSPKIQGIVRLIERIRDSAVNVLITGESGTGKELVARAIHWSSPRAKNAFVALNCAALPETLLESELFGIDRGVATGVEPRMGHFQAAGGGTLFLDEIGDLSLTAQAKILRVLQERVIERVGSRSPMAVDVRVLAATNKDLEAEISRGRFREDLYYRLKVIHIHTPALCEIREDIPLLARHFLREYCRDAQLEPLDFAAGVPDRLAAGAWPGNTRQLRNEVIRLAACARGGTITEADLAEGGAPPLHTSAIPMAVRPERLKDAVEELERRMVREALEASRHNQWQAARALGLSRQGLINKMKRYRITAAQ